MGQSLRAQLFVLRLSDAKNDDVLVSSVEFKRNNAAFAESHTSKVAFAD